MKILLIAGHGGKPYDSGAIGFGFKEAVLTREVVGKVEQALKPYASVTVFDTGKDMYRHLKTHTFNFKAYDYTLEVHFNAGANDESGNGRTTGTEVLVHPMSGQGFEAYLCRQISALGLRNRGVKTRSDLANMNVAKRQGATYSLLEVCFIDDRDDMDVYLEKSSEICNTIAETFKHYYSLEATEVKDIISILYERNIITDTDIWKYKLSTNSNAYWLARKAANLTVNSLYRKALDTVNDIVWELSHRGIITEKSRWIELLNKDRNLYWLAYKIANLTENKA